MKRGKIKDTSAAEAVMESIHNPKPFNPGTPKPEAGIMTPPPAPAPKSSEQSAAEDKNVAVGHEIKFKSLAVEIITATMEVGKKYLNLCTYIRTEKIAPKQATTWLLDLGFAKSRASEINRVAQASDEVFSQLQARALGWKGALELARGGEELKQALIADREAIDVVSEVMTEAIRDEESAAGAKKPTKAELLKEYRAALDRHATAILKLVAGRKGKGVRAEKWDLGSGWKLCLVPGKKGVQDVTPPDAE